ncbi:hypothetical protein HY745_02715 [Candidatus Desantisbacteria bacterium]|nr:hypothetical protein [Candidatus Desantisbacteria bacterium]
MSTHEMVEEEELYARFTFFQMFTHVLVMITFVLLVMTGLPQKFWYAPWAHFVGSLFGGAESMRKVHHTSGIISAFGLVFHFGYLIYRWVTENWKSLYNDFIMVPNPNDGWAIVQNFKYWLFLTDEPAEYDEIGWKEKLDYWAVCYGTIVFTITGLMMWFSHIATKIVPAWSLYIAWTLHSYEAFLATLVIFIWHFYNVHLMPEKFPIGTTMWYSGKANTEDMVDEHLAFYKELKGIPSGKTGLNRLRRGKVRNRDANTGGFIPREHS